MKHKRSALFFALAAVILAPAFASAQQGPPPTCTLSSSAGVVQKGGTVNLRWNSANAVSGTITSIGSVGPSGIQGVIPTQTTEYVGIFAGANGTARCTVTVIVTLPTGGTTLPPGGVQAPEGGNSAFPEAPSVQTGEPDIRSETGGLVPCTGLNCQACHLASLVQNIIKFLIMLAIPIVALLFAVAGAMYFSSEVTNKKEQAKKIIQKAVVGFIIAISAWMVVNTVLYILFEPPQGGGNWLTIQCVSDSQRRGTSPQNSGSILQVLNNVLGVVPPPTQFPAGRSGGGGGPVGECPAGYTFLGVMCHPEDGGAPVVPTYPSTNSGAGSLSGLQQYSAALSNACVSNGLDDCAVAQAILVRESGGRAGAVSHMGAGGLMQVMPATARGLDPARLAGLSDSEVLRILTTEPDYNMHLGTKEVARLYNKYNGDVSKVAAAYNGGDKANVCGADCQRMCGGGTAWQCTAFPGYNETRKYVPNVVATYTALKNQ